MNQFVSALYRWLRPVVDPLHMMAGLRHYGWFLRDWRSYGRLPQAEPLVWANSYPQLHDKTAVSTIDPHYYFVNAWAMRRIMTQNPAQHVDIASQTIFANLLAAVLPVLYIDYRPLNVKLSGLSSIGADILHLPIASQSLSSISCLHVAEHIGLGRYGDPLNPQGTRQAAQEIARILKPGGDLYFALPVGHARLCFNAHRIHQPETICEFFSELNLIEFSGVDDQGQFIEAISPTAFANQDYACGMYHFRRYTQRGS